MYRVESHKNTLRQRNGYMDVSLEIDIQCLSIDRDRACSIRPVIVEDGCCCKLPQILLDGKLYHKDYSQIMSNIEVCILHNERNGYQGFKVIK